ncbi:MAG: AMP-binding protein [Myxococcota bacterium]|nr:AMP-binding protein [Myxococcota bacterium]
MTLPALLIQQLRQNSYQNWLRVPVCTSEGLSWTSTSRAEVERQISGMVVRLYALGVGEGVKVAICADTCAEWLLLDLAVLSLRGIVVGIYPTLPAEDIIHQLNDSESELLFVQDDSMAEKLKPYLDELETVCHVFALCESQTFPQIMPAEPDLELFERLAAQVQPTDVATLIYTSGTTGNSKGVVLKHAHLVSALRSSAELFPLRKGDRSIIYLPMAHILQRFVVYRALIDDVEGAVSPSLEYLPEVIQSIRPHLLVVVPRVLEKILNRAEQAAIERGDFAHLIFRWAMKVAYKVGNSDLPKSQRLMLQAQVAERLVFSKIRDGLGGQLRCILSGAAPLSPKISAIFWGMGLQVVEGWGLSESCGPATLINPEQYQLGSVGRILDSLSIRRSIEGELQLKGESLFEGYWKQAAATEAAFTEDGWFKTGDIGHIDEDGYVWITGRIKDLIVTAGGKNIAPQPIELLLNQIGDVHTVVLGDNRPYLIALFAPENTLSDGPSESKIKSHVHKINLTLPRYAQIKRWAILSEAFHPENGLLTPTLKPKRNAIQKTHSRLIESLYSESRTIISP